MAATKPVSFEVVGHIARQRLKRDPVVVYVSAAINAYNDGFTVSAGDRDGRWAAEEISALELSRAYVVGDIVSVIEKASARVLGRLSPPDHWCAL